MLTKDKDWKKMIPSVIMNLFCIFMVATIANASAYTILGADDYVHGNGVGAFGVGFFEYLKASLRYAKTMYLTWQRTYFSMFIQALLSSINNYRMSQLRVVMISNAQLFLEHWSFL